MVAKHPHVASVLNNISGAWYALGDSRDAKKKLLAYSIYREFYGDEHPDTRTVKEWRGSLKR